MCQYDTDIGEVVSMTVDPEENTEYFEIEKKELQFDAHVLDATAGPKLSITKILIKLSDKNAVNE